MCGLAGLFRPGEAQAIDASLLRRMTTAIRHRGPDGDGFHIEPGVGLGHRRLAIIDIGGGDQPMFNEDGSVVIVFVGEIYNHALLRPELESLGHVFRTRCDTEAIIHAWESWGPDCLRRLAGMFSFALWDLNRGQLFLARDRLGKKPLHYAWLPDGGFAFGSELAALTAIPMLPRRIAPTAVDDFFTFGYIPDPATIYRDVHKLPAAHYLLLGRDGRRAPPVRYWRVPTDALAIGEADAVPLLTDHLHDAVAKRMMADVPLGAFLSGGVDSSAPLSRQPPACPAARFPLSP